MLVLTLRFNILETVQEEERNNTGEGSVERLGLEAPNLGKYLMLLLGICPKQHRNFVKM
jgi:hypothetical protein